MNGFFLKCKFKNSISELTSCGFKGKNMSPSKTTPATGRQQPRETPTIAVLLRIKASNDDIYPTGDEFGGFHQVRERVFLFGCCHRASLADGALSCVVHRAGRIDVFAFTNCWEGRTTLWRMSVWWSEGTDTHTSIFKTNCLQLYTCVAMLVGTVFQKNSVIVGTLSVRGTFCRT